ncbi:hypothetical protein BDB01DRAFT_849259 [Pilobolus umbonatus]|nr:hypothetical protein BDB01DRAFT_849259 [Pilobolus umbonatus]
MVLKDNQHSVDEQLIKDTQGKVDSINWASYRPYLKPNVEKSFIRQSLIFGVLINSDDNIYESTRKLSASQQQGQYNILPMANQSARFTLLPIGHTMSSNLRSR